MAHLQREEKYGQSLLYGGVSGHSERKRRLPHRWAGADDDQRARLEPEKPLIKVRKARGYTGNGAPAVVQSLEMVEAGRQQLPQRLQGIRHSSLNDLEDHG